MESDNQKAKTDMTALHRIRKPNRYQQLDDFAVIGTPPQGSEGPFYSNLVGGQKTAKTDSMYDRINRELSGGEKNLLTGTAPKTSLSDSICASLSVGLSGISLNQAYMVPTEANIVIPAVDENSPPKLIIGDIAQARYRKISHFDTKHIDQNELLEVFNELKSLREEDSPAITAPVLPVAEHLPQSSFRQRKVSAPPSLSPAYILDSNRTTSMANFFFNGGLTSFCGKMSTNPSVPEIKEDSVVPSINTDQKVALNSSIVNPNDTTASFNASPPISPALSTKKVMKRRINKTALREMNLWAPQSM